MVKVKVTEGFNDRTDSKYKKEGNVLTVSEDIKLHGDTGITTV